MKPGRRSYHSDRPNVGELPIDEDVERELHAHIGLCVDDLIAAGMSPEDARVEASRRFGDVTRISDECILITRSRDRAVRRAHIMDSIVQDFKFAFRSFRRSPGFAVVAILTIALGIGANTAIFSVIDQVLLRPLPYPDADRIVTVWERSETGASNHLAGANFVDWQNESTSFTAIAVHPSYAFGGRSTVLGGVVPSRVWVGSVSIEFFNVMGVLPALGRTFSTDEAAPNANPTVVVSHRFWRDVLGSPESLDGVSIEAFGTTAAVIGVMPLGFTYPKETDVWFPVELFGPLNSNPSRTSHNYAASARLAPGVTAEEAQAELDRITERLRTEYADDMDAFGAVVTPLQEELVGGTRGPLLLLMAAAGLVLLIACANVASTLLARGSNREQEMAIRASVGAGRSRIVRQLLTESLVLAGIGAAIGLLLGLILVKMILASSPESLPDATQIGLDGTVLLFTSGMTILTAFAFGLLPALRSAGSEGAQKPGGRGSQAATRPGQTRIWNVLVGSEVALSLILLMGAGLLVKSLYSVLSVDSGMDPEGVVVADITLPSSRYVDDPAVAGFHREALDRIRAIAGVETIGLTSSLPLEGLNINGAFDREGIPEMVEVFPDYRVASEQYFGSMGIELLQGRLFNDLDVAESPHVAIINRALADRVWPDGDAIGSRIRNLRNDGFIYDETAGWVTIVGVVDDVRQRGLTQAPRPAIYVHYLQRPYRASRVALTAKIAGNAAPTVTAIREQIRQMDPNVPVEIYTMDSVVRSSISVRTFTVQIFAGFAVLALILAFVGVYGVVSYSVSRRKREIGIRLALGAEPTSVRRMVVGGSMTTILLGLLVGIVGVVVFGRVVRSLLYEVSTLDPATFAGVTLVLATAALLASYIPARRSTRVDPVTTMRAE